MKRARWMIAALAAAFMLGGCQVMTMVAAVPAAIVEPIFGQFGAEERSLPVTMRAALYGVTKALARMDLRVDTLEYADEGYDIGFASEKLEGRIQLLRQTGRLTTVRVRVKSKLRQESVETAVLDLVEQYSRKARRRDRARFRGYKPMHEKPDRASAKIGIYRPGARLNARAARREGWLEIKLPSGHRAYVEGRLKGGKGKGKTNKGSKR